MKRSRSSRIARRLDGLLVGGALQLGGPALAQSTDPKIKNFNTDADLLYQQVVATWRLHPGSRWTQWWATDGIWGRASTDSQERSSRS